MTPQAGTMRLVAENLEGRRGGQLLFAGLNFVLAPGEAILVTGPNGAGKSTLLRIAAGLLPVSGGSVRLEGGTLAAHAHYLSTADAMKPALTVGENLRFWEKFFAASRDEDTPQSDTRRLGVEDALEAVGLLHTLALPFGVLSTGQRRRAALARLLLDSRPLWLLDEPASGLDADAEAGLSTLLKAHLAKGGMVLAAVHDDPGLSGAQEIRLGVPPVERAA